MDFSRKKVSTEAHLKVSHESLEPKAIVMQDLCRDKIQIHM